MNLFTPTLALNVVVALLLIGLSFNYFRGGVSKPSLNNPAKVGLIWAVTNVLLMFGYLPGVSANLAAASTIVLVLSVVIWVIF